MARKEGLDAYDASIGRATAVFANPEWAAAYSESVNIADVIYTAVTDGRDQGNRITF